MAERLERRFPAMGTTVHLVVVGGDAKSLSAAETRIQDLERRWSRFLPDSELSKLNERQGANTIVSADTFRLVTTAIEAWELTAGRFDPTVLDGLERAGYDRSFDLLPTDRPLTSMMAKPGPAPTPGEIALDSHCSSVTLPQGVRLDLGGLAKGAAADLVAGELLAAGVDGCCVNIGGDLRLAGRPPRPEGWTVTLGSPERQQTVDAQILSGAVCTSTTMRRRWKTSAGTEHHLRDPATGGRTTGGIETVSVLGATATQAEVLTKAAIVSGITDGQRLLIDCGVTGLLVTDDGRSITLAGLERFTADAEAKVS